MRYLVFFAILIGIVSSCNIDDSTEKIGNDFVQSNTNTYFIDSLTVKPSTIIFDSLAVSNATRLLVGSYNDPVFGRTFSKSYIQLSNSNYDLDNDAVYDSIAIILKYDNYFYNDTIPNQEFKIYEVLDDIEPDDDDNYYNVTEFEQSTTPIAIKNFVAQPNKQDSLEIKINDDFGSTLFDKLKDNEINNSDEFLQEYKGLVIEADSTLNTAVLGFSTDSYLRIYYSVDDGDSVLEEQTLDFSFNTSNTFNHINSNKTGTFFEDITSQDINPPSSETDDSAFIQSGTGITTRLDMPYIKSLNDISFNGYVVDAQLKLSLKRNLYPENLHTRDSIQAIIIDKNANIIGNLTYDDGNNVLSTIVNEDEEFETDTYTFNVKTFIDLKLSETYDEYFLVFYCQDFNSSVDRYIFNSDINSENSKIKLELIYATYD